METAEGQISELFPAKNYTVLEKHVPELFPQYEYREPEWEVERRSRIKQSISSGKAIYPKNVKFFWGTDKKPEKLKGNRCLLASSSLEFARFLNERIHENIIEINDVNPRDFRTMLEYLMGEFTWKFTTIAETCSLIEASVKFGLTGLNDEIFRRLNLRSQQGQEHLDDENACRAWCLFKQYDRDNYLARSAKQYILRNGENIFGGDHFLNLPLKEFEEILKDDGLTINCELDVFKAVLRWGINDLKTVSRLCTAEALRLALSTLIPYVRFSNVTETEFKNYVIRWNFLTPEQLEWMERFWKKEQDATKPPIFDTKRRNYIGKIDDAKTPEDLLLKIRSKEADLFYANHTIDFDRHNLNLELQKVKSILAKQQSTLTRLEQEVILASHRVPGPSQNLAVDINYPLSNEVELKLRNDLTKLSIAEKRLLSRIEAQHAEIVKLHGDLASQSTESRELRRAQENQSRIIMCIWNEFILTKTALKSSVNTQKTLEKKAWFLNEIEKEAAVFTKTAMDLLTDGNPEGTNAVILLHNDTPLKLVSPSKYFCTAATRDHIEMPVTIGANSIDGFGFTCTGSKLRALFSYNIGQHCIVVCIEVDDEQDRSSVALGIFSAKIALSNKLFTELSSGSDWSNLPDKRKSYGVRRNVTTELDIQLEMRDFRVQATMKPGKKTLVSVVISQI